MQAVDPVQAEEGNARETRGKLPQHIVASVGATVIVGLIGAFSVCSGQPWLAPSLGSAAFLQILTPDSPSARAWNTIVGQLIGVASGFIGVFVAGAASAPGFLPGHPLVWPRVLGVVIATLLTAVLQLLLKATSAAGGATALVVALGAETATLDGASRLVVGIVLVTLMGETVRQIILRQRSSARPASD